MADRLGADSVAGVTDPAHSAVARLVRAAALPAVKQWTPVRGGANNRVFCGLAGPTRVLLKIYFGGEGDHRDRLRGENFFYGLAKKAGVRSLPEALGWDPDHRLGLFSFIEGRKLQADQVTAEHVRCAGRFVVRVNEVLDPENCPADSPIASEACFCLHQHLDLVQARLDRLRGLPARDRLDREASSWIANELTPAWHQVRQEALARAAEGGLDPRAPVPPGQRWISPSDFGFHNALLENGGNLKFFDFEYAGWDDPAKLVCDFFCQLAVPVPFTYWREFLGVLQKARGWNSLVEKRAKILLSVYRIKWCCIALNDFLAPEAARRNFSAGGAGDRRSAQLVKAQGCLRETELTQGAKT